MVWNDPLSSLLTVISNNWNSANTDDVTPNIDRITNNKRIEGDNILVYRMSTDLKANAFGVLTRSRTENITIDIRSTAYPPITLTTLESHFTRILTELDRIIQANILTPGGDWQHIDPDSDVRDLSDKSRGLFRAVWEIRYIDLNEAR